MKQCSTVTESAPISMPWAGPPAMARPRNVASGLVSISSGLSLGKPLPDVKVTPSTVSNPWTAGFVGAATPPQLMQDRPSIVTFSGTAGSSEPSVMVRGWSGSGNANTIVSPLDASPRAPRSVQAPGLVVQSTSASESDTTVYVAAAAEAGSSNVAASNGRHGLVVIFTGEF